MSRSPSSTERDRAGRSRRCSAPAAGALGAPLRLAALCLVALLAAGCTVAARENVPRAQRADTVDGLAKVSTRGPGALYVKRDHPVGSYDDIMVASIGISYAPGQRELDEEDEDVIFDRMVGALSRGVAAEFGLAKEPGPCTVKMGLYLTNVDFYESEASGSQTRFVNSYGAATLVFEFRDSMSDEPLVRYGQRRSFGSGVDAGRARGPDLERLGDTLDKMLEDVGRTLQEVVPVSMDARSEHGCSGNLGMAVAAES